MRLVFVHGINQQNKDPDTLKKTWIEDLEVGLGAPGALAGAEIVMPFYGDVLFDLAGTKPDGAIAQGADAAETNDLSQFLSGGLDELAVAEGISSADIAAEQQSAASDTGVGVAVEQGFPMSRRINAVVSLLEKISPLRGDLALRLLDQAHAYLKRPHVGPAVDEVVRPALGSGTTVVVSHSLGTIVTFKLLRAMAVAGHASDVPLYITLGSPLTLSTVQRALGPSFQTPAGVGQWINVRDPDDSIALNRGLGSPLFSTSVENIGDFENPGADAHAIPGYLQCRPVAQAVSDALGL